MGMTADLDLYPSRQEILSRMAAASRASDRDPAATVLVAVSKRQPENRIDAMLAAGQTVFGENRVQEAMQRWEVRRKAHANLQLHLVGPLQTNKAREAVAFFDVIESVDRPKLARSLADACEKEGRNPKVFIQVNTGEEPQKSGVAPKGADAFIASVRDEYRLDLKGLMCIPPAYEPPGPHFALLAKIAAANGLGQLSMGMSADFETAIRFGATYVRVGSALFGEREG
ncbi:MAG: YggS family pyridoxal phosphate-dependent enzyme [Pseudomonadota bacterium]